VCIGKGGNRVMFPITDTIREILFPLRGQHPEFCFTYIAACTNKRLGRVRGERYPMTMTGAKSAWQRLRAKAGVKDLRFHDFRHDLATKLLRETGNLRLVQKALNHGDIKSTLRYAHVLDAEVAADQHAGRCDRGVEQVKLAGVATAGPRNIMARCRVEDWHQRWSLAQRPSSFANMQSMPAPYEGVEQLADGWDVHDDRSCRATTGSLCNSSRSTSTCVTRSSGTSTVKM
jgi:Phage integrase family